MSAPWGEWTCPLYKSVMDWSADGESEIVSWEPCGATLHLCWSFSWPVPSEDEGQPYSREEVALNAYTDGWEVTCENGHTIARSAREENAEPFDMKAIMRTAGAKQITGSAQ